MLANVQAMARAGELIPSRLPAVFLTLERNRQWWTTEPLLSGEQRVSFPPSKIIWEHYAGQGIEIQWLATFGEANGYYLSGHENANLRQLLGEVIPLATQRAGGIAWEYMFDFDGGAPPWTSGLSQGTALQVLSRAWSRFKEPAYLTAAQQALGIFQTPPPQGVRVKTPAGAMYAEYTYAPSDRILNGFIQALVGLYDYTSITKDPLGLTLFEAGDAEARAIVPQYDTGAWSMYDQFGESNLNYHELLTEFLQHLCERTSKGQPIPPATTPPTSTTPTTTTTPTATARHHHDDDADDHRAIGTGGVSPSASAARVHAAADEHADPRRSDLLHDRPALHRRPQTPPVVSLLSKTLPAGARAGVQISLSKISTVRLTVRQGSKVVWTNSATLERGKPKLLWITPAKGGQLLGRADRHRPRGQLLDDERHHRRQRSLASCAAPRLGASDRDRDDPRRATSADDAARRTHGARSRPSSRLGALTSLGLFVSMFLPWYSKTDTLVVHGVPKAAETSLSAFQAFSFVEAAVLLVSAGVLACCSRAPRGACSSSPAATARS